MSDFRKQFALPELLCPAGSPEALDAAIEGGADAVYLGGTLFNARMNAHNFDPVALRNAVLRAHTYGVKVYLTLNTLVTDREIPDFVRAAEDAYLAGVDALIVADAGGAAAIHRTIPTLELHASTQMSGHSAQMGAELQKLGFSRMVLARESSVQDIRTAVKNSPIEIEIFVHGALCVCHSGQCLFSSVVGGRSGNRGECAQPCRLPYSVSGSKVGYPLSLKDLSLAEHVPELIEMGVASLKIEGRMKSPEYVRDNARIWRRLLDEGRGATPAEMKQLADVFSRGGFTDGYYKGKIGKEMLGIRSDADKQTSRVQAPFEGLTRKIPLDMKARVLRGRAAEVVLSDGAVAVTVTGDEPMEAQNAPLTEETVARNLQKFGGTPFSVRELSLELDAGLMLPISRLNDLRRRALSALEEARSQAKEKPAPGVYRPLSATGEKKPLRSARFLSATQITDRARAYFDRIYLPLTERDFSRADGVVLPPVIFDHEREDAAKMLQNLTRDGVRYALVGNIGHLSLVRDAGLIPVGDFRLNVTNEETVARLESLGIKEVLLSPELTLPQARDVGGNVGLIVYGRTPLMILEKCVGKDLAGCDACRAGRVTLSDRRGVSFPVLKEWQHRSVIYNSLPTGLSDRLDLLDRANLINRHFLFSVETPEEIDRVVDAYRTGTPLPFPVRRIAK